MMGVLVRNDRMTVPKNKRGPDRGRIREAEGGRKAFRGYDRA